MVVRAVNNNSGREILDAEIANKGTERKAFNFRIVCIFDQLFAFGAFRFLITAGRRKRVAFVASGETVSGTFCRTW
jgi:hypothetical protein